MRGLVASEWVKATSTRMWWILFVVAAGLTGLSAASLLLVSSTVGGGDIPGTNLTDPAVLRSLLATMGSGQVIALILGILGFTSEYRYGTITDTFLTQPRRGEVITAKALVHAGLGVLLAFCTSAVALGLILIFLPSQHHAPLTTSAVLQVFAGVVLCYALYAVLGVAVGALITNQIAAVVIALLWVMLVESLIVAFLPEVGKWLPGGAASGVLAVQAQSIQGVGTDLLPTWLATLVLLGYAAVFSIAAALTTLRRDIT